MQIRSIIGGVVLLPFIFSGPALAGDMAEHALFKRGEPAAVIRASFLPSGWLHNSSNSAPAVVAQADPQVDNLQDAMRKLNGKIEELNFQMLQMQDQMRKMQEDDEFRFQELEKKHSDVSAPGHSDNGSTDSIAASAPADTGQKAAEDSKSDDSATATAGGRDTRLGALPKPLGSMTLNTTGDSGAIDAGKPIDLLNQNGGNASDDNAAGSGATAAPRGTKLASLPDTDNPEELYQDSYQSILSGDYSTAERGFRQHIDRFPRDPRAADAHFWLGEALLGQDKYQDAAQVFLDANRTYPKSKKAPDMLLKLGIALSAMKQRDIACATYKEVGTRYPQASEALVDRVKEEEALAGC